MRTPPPFDSRGVATLVLVLAGCLDQAGPTAARLPAHVMKVSGDAQVGVVAHALPEPLVVRVVDADGVPLPGITVELRATPGSGQPQNPSVTTDLNGLARVLWTLGTAARVAQHLVATVKLAGAQSLSADFSATGTPDDLAQLIKASGDAQTGSLGVALPESLTIVAADRFANGVGGAPITWTVSSGGGTVAPRSATTDTLGRVTAAWVLGPRLNVPHVVMVSAGGLAPASFSATAELPTTAVVRIFSGDSQRDTVGKAAADSLAAQVTLANGTPIEGAAIHWAVAGGGGFIAPATSATDRDGVARTEWTLGTTTGENRATAAAAPIEPLTFVATGIADSPATVAKVGGDDQHGVPGQLARDSLAVVVRDQYGNAVPETEVVFAISLGNGEVSSQRVMTDDDGRAAIAFRVGISGAENEVSASAGSAPPAKFTISGTPGDDWSLAILAGDGQTTQTRGSLTGLRVRLTDGRSRPMPGAAVAWHASAGGSPAESVTTTDANGIASNAWTLGCPARQSMVATVQSLAPVTFAAEATERPAYVAAFRRPQIQVAYSSAPLRVTVKDEVGCAVSGVEAPWAIVLPANASWPVTMKIEPVAGLASDTAGRIDYVLTLGGLIRRQHCATLPAGLTPYASDSTGYFCVIPQGSPISLAITPSAAVVPNPGASVTLRATARDAAGRELWGVAYWRILDPSIATGVREGYDDFRITGIRAGATWAVAEDAQDVGGPNPPWPTATAEVRVVDVPSSPATVSAGNLSDLVGSIGSPTQVIAYITDAAGTPVPGATVSWALESGNGSFAAAASISDAHGEARMTFTPGPVSGSNIVTATLNGVGTARYLVWAPAANPVRIVRRGGDRQTGFVGHQLTDSITVRIEDEHGNGVYDQDVVFAVAIGGGHVERTQLRTDTLGIAGTRWTTGILGTNTATATWNGQSVTFTATGASGGGLGIVMPNGSETWYSAPGQFPQQVRPSLVVRVIDDQGAPAAGVTVTWGAGASQATTLTDGAGMTSYAPLVWIANPMTWTFTASVPGGATAVFAVIATPSGGATTCGPNIIGPRTAPVGSRLPGPVVVSCFSNRGSTVTSVTVSVSGGFLMPVPGYRPSGEWRYYWVMPNAPGTYEFRTSGFPGIPQSTWATATP